MVQGPDLWPFPFAPRHAEWQHRRHVSARYHWELPGEEAGAAQRCRGCRDDPACRQHHQSRTQVRPTYPRCFAPQLVKTCAHTYTQKQTCVYGIHSVSATFLCIHTSTLTHIFFSTWMYIQCLHAHTRISGGKGQRSGPHTTCCRCICTPHILVFLCLPGNECQTTIPVKQRLNVEDEEDWKTTGRIALCIFITSGDAVCDIAHLWHRVPVSLFVWCHSPVWV